MPLRQPTAMYLSSGEYLIVSPYDGSFLTVTCYRWYLSSKTYTLLIETHIYFKFCGGGNFSSYYNSIFSLLSIIFKDILSITNNKKIKTELFFIDFIYSSKYKNSLI